MPETTPIPRENSKNQSGGFAEESKRNKQIKKNIEKVSNGEELASKEYLFLKKRIREASLASVTLDDQNKAKWQEQARAIVEKELLDRLPAYEVTLEFLDKRKREVDRLVNELIKIIAQKIRMEKDQLEPGELVDKHYKYKIRHAITISELKNIQINREVIQEKFGENFINGEEVLRLIAELTIFKNKKYNQILKQENLQKRQKEADRDYAEYLTKPSRELTSNESARKYYADRIEKATTKDELSQIILELNKAKQQNSKFKERFGNGFVDLEIDNILRDSQNLVDNKRKEVGAI